MENTTYDSLPTSIYLQALRKLEHFQIYLPHHYEALQRFYLRGKVISSTTSLLSHPRNEQRSYLWGYRRGSAKRIWAELSICAKGNLCEDGRRSTFTTRFLEEIFWYCTQSCQGSNSIGKIYACPLTQVNLVALPIETILLQSYHQYSVLRRLNQRKLYLIFTIYTLKNRLIINQACFNEDL